MQVSKKSSTFAPAFEKEARQVDEAQFNGAVVQLVRIPACHAVGREFESCCPCHKSERLAKSKGSFFFAFLVIMVFKSYMSARLLCKNAKPF